MTPKSESISRTVIVQTGARLHFGFLSCKPAAGRQFGGVGVMVDSPRFEIVVRESEEFAYQGPPIWRDRITKHFTQLQERDFWGVRGVWPAPADDSKSSQQSQTTFEVEIRKEIPAHVGFGSGTQLAMALSAAVSRFRGEQNVRPEFLAARVSRGARSALGVHGFARGGFLHDIGKLPHEDVGYAAACPFPSEWRFVLVTPPAETGLAGREEIEAFANLPPMPVETSDRLKRILTTDLLPAVHARQYIYFSESLFEFGRIVGEYFAPVQGGIYANRRMAELVDHLRKRGVYGVGQTSWGPTIFALCESEADAELVARDIQSGSRWSDCEFRVTAARNSGADVCFLADSGHFIGDLPKHFS